MQKALRYLCCLPLTVSASVHVTTDAGTVTGWYKPRECRWF